MGRESVALSLPGFGVPRPAGFTGTKDAYAEWLAGALRATEAPVDVVGHDIGALITMRVVSALDVPVRSWVVDVANIFHPDFEWPERVHQLQAPGVGEEMLREACAAGVNEPQSLASRLVMNGTLRELANEIGAAHDEVMSQSILDFYRSADPNVSTGWWGNIKGPTPSRGLVLLLPDPPEDEAMSLEVAKRLGADTARLDDLNHCWMAEAPDVVVPVLERFWASLES